MSTVAEIEAAIAKLTPSEFTELAEWIAAQRSAREFGEDHFDKAMNKVFSHHAPLLKKLAQ